MKAILVFEIKSFGVIIKTRPTPVKQLVINVEQRLDNSNICSTDHFRFIERHHGKIIIEAYFEGIMLGCDVRLTMLMTGDGN